MLERSRRVVLLIDYDNLQICASRDTPGRDLQLTPVVQLAQKYGTVILARAYAEWNLSTERLAVYKAGIEPAFAPVLRTESDRSGKSLADTVMVAEGMDMLWTLSPEVVVLATSDKDLIPLVRVAKQRGAYVVVLGSDFTAIPLREMADEHITYKQLITDASGRFTTEGAAARPAATAAEPTRRRTTRERNGREPRTGAATTTTSPTPATRPERESRTEREARTERESRAEREPASNATVPSAAGAPEPVAPVASGTPGEIDGQVGSRRRRRRGSRRRSERVGVAGEAGAGVENGAGDGAEIADVELTAPEVDMAAPPEVLAPPEAHPEVEPEPTPAPAPRERRRRTTRRTTAAPEDAAAPATPSAASSSAGDAASPAAATPPAAEAAPPVSEPPAEVTPAPDTSDTAEPAPARRPRRVASASRGRSRTVR